MRRALVLLASILLLLGAVNFGVAWYYSVVLYELDLEVRDDEVEYNIVAIAVCGGLVKLESCPESAH